MYFRDELKVPFGRLIGYSCTINAWSTGTFMGPYRNRATGDSAETATE